MATTNPGAIGRAAPKTTQPTPATATPTNLGTGNDFASFLSQYMTPEQLAAASQPVTQAPTNAAMANGGITWAPQSNEQIANNLFNQGYQTTDAAYGVNGGLISDLGNYGDSVTTLDNGAMSGIWGQIGGMDPVNAAYEQQSQGLVNQLGGLTTNANNYDWANLGNYTTGLSSGIDTRNAALGQSMGILNSVSGPIASQVSWDGDLTSQAAQADQQVLGAQYQALGQLQGIGNGSLDYYSQAAGAYANGADVQNEEMAANQLNGIANGSNDVSTASLAGINDLATGMYGGYDYDFANSLAGQDLEGAAHGSLNIDPINIAGYSDLDAVAHGAQNSIDPTNDIAGYNDLYGVFKGSNDVHVGQSDPAAYAASLDAQQKYKDLTTPEVTSAERFIYEQARTQQEQDDRANRAAVAADFRQRGINSAGAEVAQSALGGQQTSQNRLLSDLGAQAQAVQRSMQALGGYADVSTNLNAQANAIAAQNQVAQLNALNQYTNIGTSAAQSNQATRENALNQYTNIGTQVAQGNQGVMANATGQYADINASVGTANMNRRLNANEALTSIDANVKGSNADRRTQGAMAYSNATSNLRNESFDESYKRGVAADNASANNQSTRLQGTIASGQQANTMQDQAFRRGAAADQTAQFNRVQSIGVDEYNTTFNQNEAIRRQGVADSITRDTSLITGQNDKSYGDVFGAGQKTNADTFGRSAGVLSAQDTVNGRIKSDAQTQTDARIRAYGTQIGVNDAAFQRKALPTGLKIQNNLGQAQNTQQHLDQQAGLLIGDEQADTAAADLKKQKYANTTTLWGDDDSGLKIKWF